MQYASDSVCKVSVCDEYENFVLGPRPHGDVFSSIRKNLVIALVFWERETAIFLNRVPEWINLKTTPLCFHVDSQSVYFVKR